MKQSDDIVGSRGLRDQGEPPSPALPEKLVHDPSEEADHYTVSPLSTESSDESSAVPDEQALPSRASPALLQAILLASGEPVAFSKLQEIMRCQKSEVLATLQDLRERVTDLDDSGVEVVTVGEKLQLRTKAVFAEAVRELLAVRPRRLSQAALETLSVVAYQQPVVKSEIDKIRGVDVSPTLKTLMERKLVKIIGYQASVGQPSLYGTTEEFLRVFGLESLGALPSLRDLQALARDPGEAQDTEDEMIGQSAEESIESNAVVDDIGGVVANQDATAQRIVDDTERDVSNT
jgi:segregation and condensation protein B